MEKYYLYYAFDFMGIMGIAVSDRPQGPYEFYGHVHYKDGTVWGRKKEIHFLLIRVFLLMMTGKCISIQDFIRQFQDW